MKKFTLNLVVVLMVCGLSQAALLEVGPGKTYSTVQAAINDSQWSQVSYGNGTGDTIVVYEGTYTETVTITDKRYLNIMANPGDKVVLQGTFNLHNATSATWSDWNTISGFYIDKTGASSGWAIRGQYARSNNFENLVIYGDGSGAGGVYSIASYGLNWLKNSTVYGVHSPYGHGHNSGLHVKDSIVAFNAAGANNQNSGVVQYSNFYNNPNVPGWPSAIGDTTGSISADPLFYSVDPDSPYFLWLSTNSPSHLTGSDGANMGALSTIPEPATILLLGAGLVAVVRKKK